MLKILETLESIFRYLIGLLSKAGGGQNQTDSESEASQGEQSQQLTAGADQGSSESQTETISALQSIRQGQREHWQWLKKRPWVIVLALVLLLALVLAENWLVIGLDWLIRSIGRLLAFIGDHCLASVIVFAVLLYLVLGLRWLPGLGRRIAGGIARRKLLTGVLAAASLVILLWLITTSKTWVVLPLKEGVITSLELSGQKASNQLISELSLIRAGGSERALSLLEPQFPLPPAEGVTLETLEAACDQLLAGRVVFNPGQAIPLGLAPRGPDGDTAGVGDTQGDRLDLGQISIGAISIPSQLLMRAVLRIAPTSYREFSGQIFEHGGNFTISIAARDPAQAWDVTGPVDSLAEMVEYLALRIALDTQPEVFQSSGLERPIQNWELAFQLGNREFNMQNYVRARAFYEIASRFESRETPVFVMLGFARYQTRSQQPAGSAAGSAGALQAMSRAVLRKPDDARFPVYLHCLALKDEEEDQEAEKLVVLNAFEEFAQLAESPMLTGLEAEELDKLQVRGPGRRVSVAQNTLLFVDENGSLAGGRSDREPKALVTLRQSKLPRQVAVDQNGDLLYVTGFGDVFHFGRDTKEFTKLNIGQLGSVQQIATYTDRRGQPGLLFLDRHGGIFLCIWTEDEEGEVSCQPGEAPIFPAAPAGRQIFPVGDLLYIVGVDGDVWLAEIVDGEVSAAPRQLTSGASVKEIFATRDDTGDITVFMLHDDGSISQKNGRVESEALTRIDQGTGTVQIFATNDYLYVLKGDGAVWRISNPRNPNPKSDFVRLELTSISPDAEGTFSEIYVVQREPVEEGEPPERDVYLYTTNNFLLKGTDTGEQQMTLKQEYAAAARAPSQ
jgi:hypothetical protein